MGLSINRLSAAYGKHQILKEVSIDNIPTGKLTALLGPNAAGKSTLFKSLTGILSTQSGDVFFSGQSLSDLNKTQRLEKICYMPQQFSSDAMLSVFDVVLLARKNLNDFRVNEEDLRVVENLLRRFDIEHLADRYISELSGGQQQLVSLCQALVRDASIYLLDEPTSALDLGRQLHVLDILKEEAALRNAVIILAIHDLSLAARHAEHVMLLKDGHIVLSGNTEAVFSSKELGEVYGVNIEIVRDSKQAMMVSAYRI